MDAVRLWRNRGGYYALGLALLLAIAGLAAACTSESPTATTKPTVTPAPTATSVPTAVAPTATPEGDAHTDDHTDGGMTEGTEAGYAVYVSVGCSACHGGEAEGTSFAPGLSGHSEAQVRRQVRAPVGTMPVFTTDRLPEADLVELVAYVESLGEGHTHGEGVEMADTGANLEMHHWMALAAIEDDNVEEGLHHVGHIIELVEGDHLARMQQAQEHLESGNTHDAAEAVEEMLAGILVGEFGQASMHLRLALSSVRVGNADAAVHHLEHAIGMDDPDTKEGSEEILALVQAGDLETAEHELVELLAAIGVEMGSADDHGTMEGMEDVDAAMTPLMEALEASQAGNLELALEELGHFIESATGADMIKAMNALAALEAGDKHEGEDMIAEMLGIDSH